MAAVRMQPDQRRQLAAQLHCRRLPLRGLGGGRGRVAGGGAARVGGVGGGGEAVELRRLGEPRAALDKGARIQL